MSKFYMNSSDKGESLIEVVISSVVLGLIGLLLVSSVATAKPFADKMSLMGQGVAGLNSAAESINIEQFAHCTPSNPQPYSLSVPTNPAASKSNGFAITTAELPPILVGSKSNYSAQIQVQNSPGNLNWTVEPPLPSGIQLNPSTGLISGKTDSPVTAQYVFTASNGSEKATQLLTLASVQVEVQLNNGTTWVSCNQIPVIAISTASSDGKIAQYSSNQNVSFTKGNLVSIWDSSNKNFDTTSAFVSSTNSNSFSVATQSSGASSSGFAGLSRQVNTQQVIISTIVSGTPLNKVVVKSAA